MSTLVLEVPDAVREAVAGEASRRGLTEAAWLEEAVREKLAAEAELAHLRARAARADRAAFDAVLSKVPAAPPEPGDAR
jgi:hypothetical protein